MTTTHARRLKRRFIAIGIAGCIGIGSAGALAYFLSRGTGTASQGVATGTASPLPVTITPQTVAGPALVPGGASDTFVVRAGNSNAVPVSVTIGAPVVRANAAGDVFDTVSQTFIQDCKAAWFTATDTGVTTILPAGPSAASIDTVTVSMLDSGTNQSVCESISPEIDVSAS